MALHFYNNSPFNLGTQLIPVDTYIGTGVETTFTLINKTGLEVGSTIEANATLYLRATNGFSVVGDTVVLSSAPAPLDQIVVPGVTYLDLSAYDTDDVENVSNPRVDIREFYLIDPDTIGLYTYEGSPGNDGIKVLFSDLITSVNADTSWFALACSTCDGSVGTFLATGQPLYLPGISWTGDLTASYSAGATSITVDNASGFYCGSYANVNFADSSEEIVQILTVTPATNTLTISGFNNAHSSGETMYACGYKLWAKMTVPEGAAGGEAVNLYGMGLRRIGKKVSRS